MLLSTTTKKDLTETFILSDKNADKYGHSSFCLTMEVADGMIRNYLTDGFSLDVRKYVIVTEL